MDMKAAVRWWLYTTCGRQYQT